TTPTRDGWRPVQPKASLCPIPPVPPPERIAADNFFQGGSPKTGHPISPPGPPHRQKSFLTNFRGWRLDEFSIFARPPPRGDSHTPPRREAFDPVDAAGPTRPVNLP